MQSRSSDSSFPGSSPAGPAEIWMEPDRSEEPKSVVRKAGRICYLDRCLYHYRAREDSITGSLDIRKLRDSFLMEMQRRKDLLAWGYEPERMRERIVRNALMHCIHMPEAPGDPAE